MANVTLNDARLRRARQGAILKACRVGHQRFQQRHSLNALESILRCVGCLSVLLEQGKRVGRRHITDLKKIAKHSVGVRIVGSVNRQQLQPCAGQDQQAFVWQPL